MVNIFVALLQFIRKNFSPQILILFLPAAFLVVAIAAFSFQSEKKKEFTANSINERTVVTLGKGAIEFTPKNISTDLSFVAQHSALKNLLEKPTPEALNNFSQDLLYFSKSRTHYNKIRWIDETGMERVRIDFRDGQPSIAPTEQLQNKKGSDDFTEVSKLKPGEIHVSPLDLNTQHGQIETPYKPILRIGTPVTNSHGNKRGIIVIDYLGSQMIARFNSATLASGNHTMLLNHDGYYLKSPHPEDEWGFMLKRDDLSVAQSHPAAWQRISKEDQGQFLDTDGLWTFDTVYPLKNFSGNEALGAAYGMLQPQNYQWKVVTRLSPDMLFANTNTLYKHVLSVVILLLGLLLGGSWKLVRTHARNQIAENELRISAVAFESQEAMFITDADRIIQRVNKAFIETTGFSAEEAVGQKPSILKSGRHNAAFYQMIHETLLHNDFWQGEIWNRRKNGEIYPEWQTISVVRGANGQVTHYISAFSDITKRKEAEEKIHELAFYDPLTQLPNRRLMLDRLHQALALSARNGRQGALLFVDIDNFKNLNDTKGHAVGDLLLTEASKRLRSCIRENDTAARLGGDEFVVLVEGLDADEQAAALQAETIGAKILAALGQTYIINDREYHSTASIGVTLFRGATKTVEEMLKRAGVALYQAKTDGRNAVRFFDPAIQAAVNARVALEDELRRAVALQEEFQLYYQAQVDSSGHLTGAEVLLRWLHPERGMISPSEFIPLAEETGLILPLGHWTLATACRQLAAWAQQPESAHLTLAVNVSVKQFQQSTFVDEVLTLLTHYSVNPAKLKLEITESLVMKNVDEIINKMTVLKERGIHFSMDDFGTAYSSLSYLKRLPLYQLKIDQSFIRDMLTDPNDAAITKVIISLAKTMNLAVIAEGVETEAQREFLAMNDCHAYQGYLFSKPTPVEQFEALLKRA